MGSSGIVDALLARSPESAGELFDAYGDELFQYCWLMLRSRQAALEAVIAAVLTARSQAARLADPRLLRPWLCALARAACQRHDPLPPDMADEPPARPGDPDAGNREAAWRAVMRLSPADREVLDLTVRHGMSPDDVALVTGLDDVAAAILTIGAQANLRAALGTEFGVEPPPRTVSAAKVYARLPLPPLPAGAREAVIAASRDPEQVARAVSGMPALGETGFPLPGVRRQPSAAAAPASRPVPGSVPVPGSRQGRSGGDRGWPRVMSGPRVVRRLAVGVVSAALAAVAVYLLWVMALSSPARTPGALPAAVSGSAPAGGASGQAPAGSASPAPSARGASTRRAGGNAALPAPFLKPASRGTAAGLSAYVTEPASSSARPRPGGQGGAPAGSGQGPGPSSPAQSSPAQSSPASGPAPSTSPSSGASPTAPASPTAAPSPSQSPVSAPSPSPSQTVASPPASSATPSPSQSGTVPATS
jgi:DNA-directed RNA polymerase specialized sigma24 family protein